MRPRDECDECGYPLDPFGNCAACDRTPPVPAPAPAAPTRILLFFQTDTMQDPLESEGEVTAAPGTPEFVQQAEAELQAFVNDRTESWWRTADAGVPAEADA